MGEKQATVFGFFIFSAAYVEIRDGRSHMGIRWLMHWMMAFWLRIGRIPFSVVQRRKEEEVISTLLMR
jgi:hypothetical protein